MVPSREAPNHSGLTGFEITIRTSNPLVNSQTACSQLALETHHLDAKLLDFAAIWELWGTIHSANRSAMGVSGVSAAMGSVRFKRS